MKRSDIKVVEEILFDYPAICLSLARRSGELEASAGLDDVGVVQGGIQFAEQDRILDAKLQDVEHCELSTIVELISGALGGATDEMREIIQRVFFRREDLQCISVEMDLPVSTLYRKKHGAVHYMESPCMQVYPIIRHWRQREEWRKREALKISRGDMRVCITCG